MTAAFHCIGAVVVGPEEPEAREQRVADSWREARAAVERIDAARAEKLGPTEATETTHGGARSGGVRRLVERGLVEVDRRAGTVEVTKAGAAVGLFIRDGVVLERGERPRLTWCLPVELKTGECAVLHCADVAGDEITVRGERQRIPDATAARELVKGERVGEGDEPVRGDQPADPRLEEGSTER